MKINYWNCAHGGDSAVYFLDDYKTGRDVMVHGCNNSGNRTKMCNVINKEPGQVAECEFAKEKKLVPLGKNSKIKIT